MAGFNTGGKNGFARVQPPCVHKLGVFCIVKNVEIVRDERKQGNSKVSRTNMMREKEREAFRSDFYRWNKRYRIDSSIFFFFFYNGDNIVNFIQPILRYLLYCIKVK